MGRATWVGALLAQDKTEAGLNDILRGDGSMMANMLDARGGKKEKKKGYIPCSGQGTDYKGDRSNVDVIPTPFETELVQAAAANVQHKKERAEKEAAKRARAQDSLTPHLIVSADQLES